MIHLTSYEYLICFRDFHFERASIGDCYSILDSYTHQLPEEQNPELLDADAIYRDGQIWIVAATFNRAYFIINFNTKTFTQNNYIENGNGVFEVKILKNLIIDENGPKFLTLYGSGKLDICDSKNSGL